MKVILLVIAALSSAAYGSQNLFGNMSTTDVAPSGYSFSSGFGKTYTMLNPKILTKFAIPNNRDAYRNMQTPLEIVKASFCNQDPVQRIKSKLQPRRNNLQHAEFNFEEINDEYYKKMPYEVPYPIFSNPYDTIKEQIQSINSGADAPKTYEGSSDSN